MTKCPIEFHGTVGKVQSTALAAGTFLYIAVVHIVGDEFERHDDLPLRRKELALKLVMVLLGLALMAVVAIWT